MLQSTLKAVPRLYIHRKPKVKKPTFDEMKAYIGLGNTLRKSMDYSNIVDPVTWLKTNIYTTNKKDVQKQKMCIRDRYIHKVGNHLGKLAISTLSELW